MAYIIITLHLKTKFGRLHIHVWRLEPHVAFSQLIFCIFSLCFVLNLVFLLKFKTFSNWKPTSLCLFYGLWNRLTNVIKCLECVSCFIVIINTHPPQIFLDFQTGIRLPENNELNHACLLYQQTKYVAKEGWLLLSCTVQMMPFLQ